MGEGAGLGRPRLGGEWVDRTGKGTGKGKGKGVENKGRGIRASGCCCASALGRALGGSLGSRASSPTGAGRKAGVDARPLCRRVLQSLTLPWGGSGNTPGPAPILPANSQRRPKTAVQKPFRLETNSPIGSRESLGWSKRWNSELPKPSTLGRASNIANQRTASAGDNRGRNLLTSEVGGLEPNPEVRFTEKHDLWWSGCRIRSLRLHFPDLAMARSVSSQHPYQNSVL